MISHFTFSTNFCSGSLNLITFSCVTSLKQPGYQELAIHEHIFFFKTQVTAAVSGTHLENAKNISTAKRYLVASLIVLPILSPVVVYVVYLVVATIYVFASLAQQ